MAASAGLNTGERWTTAQIIPGGFLTEPTNPTYKTTLRVSNTPIITATVQESPSLLLIYEGITITVDAPEVTKDNVVLSLRQTPSVILFRTVAAAETSSSLQNPSNSLISSAIPQSSIPQSSRSSSTAPPSEPPPNASKSSLGSGAIAGIAIGGVLLLAFIIGGWYFWRRKKRMTQTPTNTLTEDEIIRREGDGNKIVLDPHQTAPTTGAYQTQYQEMSGNGLTQELDRSHSYKYAIGGAHELKAEDRPGELPFAGVGEHGPPEEHQGTEETVPVMQTSNTAVQTSQVSPHVEAQRRREVEWLEMEETRMRQRREALLQQSSVKT